MSDKPEIVFPRVVMRHIPAGKMTVRDVAEDFARTFWDKPREIESWRTVDREHRFTLVDGVYEYAVCLHGLFYNIVRINTDAD